MSTQSTIPAGRRRHALAFAFTAFALVALFAFDIAAGTTNISLGDIFAALTGGDCPPQTAAIIVDIRLVKALTAILVGAALSVSGLQMQTFFSNPLAGPYVLGVSSGASLGVALTVMAGAASSLSTAMAAWLGAAAMLVVILTASVRLRDIMTVLILGIMLSAAVAAVVQILQYLSDDASLKAFTLWSMGSLADVTWGQFAILLPSVAAGLAIAFCTAKPLNLLLFGPSYARSMGVDLRRNQTVVILSTTLLAGTVTAFCGPVGFIGMAVPHICRMALRTSDHCILIPFCAIAGACLLLICDIISKQFTVPLNALTSLIGIPVVIRVLLKK